MEGKTMAEKTGAALAPARGWREFMLMDPFRHFQERMNRFFGETFYPFKAVEEEPWSLTTWAPACDIYETDREIVVKVELPEVKKEEVFVTVNNNVLTIRGERKFSEETKRENYHRLERSYGEFVRSFTLPTFIDPNQIQAEFKDGILRVTLAKREEAKPKQIEVKVK
jgi:HSP20 family protein